MRPTLIDEAEQVLLAIAGCCRCRLVQSYCSWTATTDEILAKVRVVQTNIRKLVENNTK